MTHWTDQLAWKFNRAGDRIAPTNSNANLLKIIKHDEELSGLWIYDEQADAVLMTRRPPWAADTEKRSYPSPVADIDASNLAEWLQDRYLTSWNAKGPIMDQIEAAAKQRAINPLVEYLDGLTWDGVERIHYWLTNYLGVPYTEYSEAIASRYLISAIARAFAPGCQVDCVLVLEGLEGLGKSSALRILAGRWFKDEKLEIENPQEAAIAIQGVWIWEIPELAGVKGKAWHDTKAFVTRPVDRYRPKYGRTAVERPRRIVFAASVNEGDYIDDERGARRFLPVRCGIAGPIDLEGLRRDRDQLWAEAVAKYRAGVPWHLETESLRELQRGEIAERRAADPWEDCLLPYLESDQCPDALTMADALTRLGIPVEQWKQPAPNRVGRILRFAGFERDERPRVEGKKGPWVWRRKAKAAGYVRRARRSNYHPDQLDLDLAPRRAAQLDLFRAAA